MIVRGVSGEERIKIEKEKIQRGTREEKQITVGRCIRRGKNKVI